LGGVPPPQQLKVESDKLKVKDKNTGRKLIDFVADTAMAMTKWIAAPTGFPSVTLLAVFAI
jgi:hypothetical protein